MRTPRSANEDASSLLRGERCEFVEGQERGTV
jgi:hypothetical protein